MGLLKTAIIGAAVYAGVKYITKKNPQSGKSLLDGLVENGPDWVDKVVNYKQDIKMKATSMAKDVAS